MRGPRSLAGAVAAVAVALTLAVPAPAAAQDTPPVGTVRQWLALDDFQGQLYRKDYTLRAVGDHVEVWVANDREFPAGDCRTQVPGATDVTDAQATDLAEQFDANIYPIETATFSTPPDRDGSNAQISGDFSGDGDKTVILVDNIRDDNFYDFPAASAYLPGFFSAQFNGLLDRNVITLDAFDWAHRSGADPPDEPTDDFCNSRPAVPRHYEATLARAWQQLAHYYTDPIEREWVNEGLSQLAQSLTGYVDTRASVHDRGADRPLYCFTGFGVVPTPYNPAPGPCGGPENSLNLWGEGDGSELPADLGHASSLMLFLHDRYGNDFIARLHRDGGQGLAGLDAALQAEGVDDMWQVLHDFQTMVLVDAIVGESPSGTMVGVPRDRVTTPSLRSTVNLANPDAHDDPGVRPNGADYVPLEGADGEALPGRELASLTFRGAETLPPLPLGWTTSTDDPDRPGNPVLWSRNDSDIDAAAVIQMTVPAADPTLRLDGKYGAEFGYDFGYVEISADGGDTYTPIAGDRTVDAPLGPGLNGTTTGFEPHSFDLSTYAGQTVLLSFRYVSDGAVNEGGLRIDDVSVGGTVVSDGDNLDAFRSPTEVRPVDVDNWNVRLVGIDKDGEAAAQAEFDAQHALDLDRAELRMLSTFPTVVAIVAYDEPTEAPAESAPYTLTLTEGEPEPEPEPEPKPEPKPGPNPVPPPPAGPSCLVRGVVLVAIEPRGTDRRPRVRLVGTADASLAGKTVTILRDDRTVATTIVRADRTIRTTLDAPKRKRTRDRARYQLVVGSHLSSRLKATRQARIITQTRMTDGRVRVRGRITGIARQRALSVRGVLLCTGERAGASRTIRTGRNGGFVLTLSPPATPGQSAVYRIRLRGGSTVTLPILLTRD